MGKQKTTLHLEELDKAYEYLNYIAHIVVRPKLSPLKYVSTMFVNAIY